MNGVDPAWPRRSRLSILAVARPNYQNRPARQTRETIPGMSLERETRKAFKVHGIVQGVSFRWWAQRAGRQLGLRGSVRNCSDGTVEIAFAGTQDAVAEMEGLLQQGPPAARVARLEELAPPEQLPDNFEIAF